MCNESDRASITLGATDPRPASRARLGQCELSVLFAPFGMSTGFKSGAMIVNVDKIFSAGGGEKRYGIPMKLTDENIGGINLIRSYAAGEVRIGETVIHSSCLVKTDQLVRDWRPQTVAELSLADMEIVLAMKPEVVVIGSGPRQQFPAPEIMGAVLSRGVGCEVMDTGAACRTYNILASEGRTVVAALLLRNSPSE